MTLGTDRHQQAAPANRVSRPVSKTLSNRSAGEQLPEGRVVVRNAAAVAHLETCCGHGIGQAGRGVRPEMVGQLYEAIVFRPEQSARGRRDRSLVRHVNVDQVSHLTRAPQEWDGRRDMLKDLRTEQDVGSRQVRDGDEVARHNERASSFSGLLSPFGQELNAGPGAAFFLPRPRPSAGTAPNLDHALNRAPEDVFVRSHAAFDHSPRSSFLRGQVRVEEVVWRCNDSIVGVAEGQAAVPAQRNIARARWPGRSRGVASGTCQNGHPRNLHPTSSASKRKPQLLTNNRNLS